MVEQARRSATITYSDLAKGITAVDFDAYDQRLFHLLGEISSDEDREGRGMLTAVVVHKGDMQPGPGFFELAERLGRDAPDRLKFWMEELKRVYAVWSARRAR